MRSVSSRPTTSPKRTPSSSACWSGAKFVDANQPNSWRPMPYGREVTGCAANVGGRRRLRRNGRDERRRRAAGGGGRASMLVEHAHDVAVRIERHEEEAAVRRTARGRTRRRRACVVSAPASPLRVGRPPHSRMQLREAAREHGHDQLVVRDPFRRRRIARQRDRDVVDVQRPASAAMRDVRDALAVRAHARMRDDVSIDASRARRDRAGREIDVHELRRAEAAAHRDRGAAVRQRIGVAHVGEVRDARERARSPTGTDRSAGTPRHRGRDARRRATSRRASSAARRCRRRPASSASARPCAAAASCAPARRPRDRARGSRPAAPRTSSLLRPAAPVDQTTSFSGSSRSRMTTAICVPSGETAGSPLARGVSWNSAPSRSSPLRSIGHRRGGELRDELAVQPIGTLAEDADERLVERAPMARGHARPEIAQRIGSAALLRAIRDTRSP